MLFTLQVELAAEPLHTAMVVPNPFAAELAHEMRGAREAVRQHSSAQPFLGFEHRDAPSGVRKTVRRGKTGEARPDDDAAVASNPCSFDAPFMSHVDVQSRRRSCFTHHLTTASACRRVH